MSQNQESNFFGWWRNMRNKVTEFMDDSDVKNRIDELQEEKAKLMKKKKISADKILQSIKNTYDFMDLQKPINKEVNEKLTSEEITRWQPIKFLFLTEENIIKILSIMVKSDQKLNKDQSKMMSPIIKKMLLDNKNVDNLIPQIKEEQILCFDDDLLKKIPMDQIKKFTSQQINCFTGKQVAILLNRKAEELYDHIAQNIDINKIFACCADYNLDWKLIINKLPVDKFADLKKESIELLSTSLMSIILKKSYESKKDLSPEQLSGVVSKIPLLLNLFDQNSIKQAEKNELESLIYYIAPEEVKNIGVPVLTHLPAETIKKFKPDQIKNFNTDQIITLLKRNDCSDYIIDNLTAEQIYNMDFQKLLKLDPDIIKKFVTKHEQKIFVSDRNAYLNNLGIIHEDTNAKVTNAELGENQVNQYSRFCEHTQSFIEALLNNNQYDLDKLILSKLTQSHLSSLSRKTLLQLIISNKIPLLKQNKNMSIDILTHWFKRIGIHPSEQINGKWICDSVNLYLDNNRFLLVQFGHKLFTDFNEIISIQQKENWKVVEPYIATIYKNKAMKDITDFNHQFSLVETQGLNENNRAKIDKLFSKANLSYAGQEIAQNLSGDVIKFLNAKQIDLLIKYGVLKHFPDNRINCFNEEEISTLDVGSIQNLSLSCIEAQKKSDALQLPTEKDFYEELTSLSTKYNSRLMSEEDRGKLIKIYDIINLYKYQKFFDTYILYFSPKQLEELLKNGDSFLLPDTVQKIKPEILFSDSEDDRKNILWKIDVMKLDFSKFGEQFYKDNFLTLDTCKKFSDTQIETIIKSENIKYLAPKFLTNLSDEKIGTFNTKYLTDQQMLALIKANKFKHLKPEIIDNENMNKYIYSSSTFSQEQQKKLIDSELFLDLKDKALENFDSDLIVRKLNDKTTDKKFIQNELLSKNLAEKNKIQKLNPDVIKEFTVKQIQILSQSKNLDLTSKQIDILLQKNYIPYFNVDFVASKLTQERVEKIESIVNDQKHAEVSRLDKTCITIKQLVSLSNTDKFRYISTEVLNQANSKLLTLEWQQKLNLENATAEQINILFTNNDFSENQIGQLLQHKEFANIDSNIIKKIGTNVTEDQLQNLNVNNIDINTLENFFSGCQKNMSLTEDNINSFFKSIEQDNKKIEIFAGIPAFQKFYFSKKDNTKTSTLNEIILQGKKSNYANDKLFFRILQNKLSISDNQNDNSETNNSQKPIEPQVKKAYQKFINKLGNEDIKKFNLKNATQSFVNYLPLKKLINLDVSVQDLSAAIKNKLQKAKDRIEGWANFWKHLKLDKVYLYFKQSTLDAIEQKLDKKNSNEKNIPRSKGTLDPSSTLSEQTEIFNKITNQQNQNRGNFNNKSNETSKLK